MRPVEVDSRSAVMVGFPRLRAGLSLRRFERKLFSIDGTIYPPSNDDAAVGIELA